MQLIRRDVKRWEDYQQQCGARGEDLGMEAWLPGKVADADNAFAHPWMRGFLAGELSPEGEAVVALQASPDLGLEEYQPLADEGDSSKLWFDDKPVERERVLEAGRKHAKDFAAIHEMAARPSARLVEDSSRMYEICSGFPANLSKIGPMLSLHAAAALSAGDEATAVADLEALLRLGNHFRCQNFLLAEVVGAGLEGSALPVIEAGAVKSAFSPASNQRLRAARRSRKIEEELAACWRGERGVFLQTLESLAQMDGRTDAGPLVAFLHPPKRFLATNRLAFCEILDPALTPPLSVAGWWDFERRTGLLPSDQSGFDPAGFAHGTYRMTGHVVGSILAQEEEMDRVFSLLAR